MKTAGEIGEGENRQKPAPNDKSPTALSPETLMDKAAQKACENRLLAIGAGFSKLPPIDDGNGCLIATPLEVSRLTENVALKPAAIISCETALATAKWVSNTLIPSARSAFPSKSLSAVRQASGYVCRQRNNRPGAKLSEHATGNAIDIAGFEFDDGSYHEIRIRQRTGSMDEAFQKAVRFSACLEFTTVLGPLSDENHADHLHFDLASRRGDYRLCRFPEIIAETPPSPGKDAKVETGKNE